MNNSARLSESSSYTEVKSKYCQSIDVGEVSGECKGKQYWGVVREHINFYEKLGWGNVFVGAGELVPEHCMACILRSRIFLLDLCLGHKVFYCPDGTCRDQVMVGEEML